MTRRIQRYLARYPRLHLRLLRVIGRGSIEKRVFLALLRRGDIVCDIGANRGHFTRLFADITGQGGAVHAFEPVPSTFDRLRDAVSDLPNVRLNACALGAAEGQVTLHLPGDDDGQASLCRHTDGSWKPGVRVLDFVCPMTTLDAYAGGLPRLDFVKCDVEGAERLVVAGATHVLDQLSPMLFLEVNPQWTRNFQYTPEDLVNDLRRRGYDRFYLATSHLALLGHDWPQASANILAAKQALHATRLRGLTLV